VKGLEHIKVKAAAGSGVVSMAIATDGSLWAWGKSKRGQLGLGPGITQALVPQRVEALAGHQVAQVLRYYYPYVSSFQLTLVFGKKDQAITRDSARHVDPANMTESVSPCLKKTVPNPVLTYVECSMLYTYTSSGDFISLFRLPG
jgi:hypothetical protein